MSKKVLIIGAAAVAVSAVVWTGGAFYTKSQSDEVIAQKVAALNEYLKDDNVQFSVSKKDSGLLSDVYDISLDGCGSSDCRIAESSVSYGLGSVNGKIVLSDAIAQKIGGDDAAFVKSIFENMTFRVNVLTGKMSLRGKLPSSSSAGTKNDTWYRMTWSDSEYELSWDRQSFRLTANVPELSSDVKRVGQDIKWDFRKIDVDTSGSCNDSLVCTYSSELTAGTLVSGEFVALDGKIAIGMNNFDLGSITREWCGLQGHISELYSGGFAACLKQISTPKDFLGHNGGVFPALGANFVQSIELAAKINGGKAVLNWRMKRSDKEGTPTFADIRKYLSVKFDASIDQKFVNGLPYGVGPSVNASLRQMSGGADDPYKIELNCDSAADLSSCELNGRSLGAGFR